MRSASKNASERSLDEVESTAGAKPSASSGFAVDLASSAFAVAALELAFYLASSDDFSLWTYLKSVAEVFAAPVYPGYKLGYPPLCLLAIAFALRLTSKIRRRGARWLATFSALLAWAVIGFATIIRYYP